MKILKHRNLLGCLFAVILAMPLIQVGVRCAYTIFNKNAKDSYSGANGYSIQYKYQSNAVNDINDIQVGHLYTLTLNSQPSVSSTQRVFLSQGVFNVDNYTERFNMDAQTLSSTLLSIRIATSTLSINDNYTGASLFQVSYTNITFPYSFDFLFYSFDSNFTNLTDYPVTESNYNEIADVDITNEGTLDNAFDYSIRKITESNNIGELKFFTWFADIFLDLDNPSNALYINFINWYFNYALLVSAVYILFLALMWFIMWVRKLLERGMDFGNRSW